MADKTIKRTGSIVVRHKEAMYLLYMIRLANQYLNDHYPLGEYSSFDREFRNFVDNHLRQLL